MSDLADNQDEINQEINQEIEEIEINVGSKD